MVVHNNSIEARVANFCAEITPEELLTKLEEAKAYNLELKKLANETGSDSDDSDDSGMEGDLEMVLPFVSIDFMKKNLKDDFGVTKIPPLQLPTKPVDYLRDLILLFNAFAKRKERDRALATRDVPDWLADIYLDAIQDLDAPVFDIETSEANEYCDTYEDDNYGYDL